MHPGNMTPWLERCLRLAAGPRRADRQRLLVELRLERLLRVLKGTPPQSRSARRLS